MSYCLNETYVKLFTEIGSISISVCLSEDVLRFLGINRDFIYLLVVYTYYIVVKISMSSSLCLSQQYIVEASFQMVKISISRSHLVGKIQKGRS